ncbi:MAG: ParB N-terminal domain-containing protein [Pseudomonadota bacterium]
MTQTTDISPTLSAPVDRFSLFKNRVLAGALLDDVKALEDSILRFGLLTPLIAAWQNGKLMIIDGRKRFAALRRLAFAGRLPHSLTKIPYVLANMNKPQMLSDDCPWVGSELLYQSVRRRHQSGESAEVIAKTLGLSHQSVRDLLCLTRVVPFIRKACHQRQISLEATKAYASMPSHAHQLMAFHRLGFGALVEDILETAQPAGLHSLAA